MRDMMHPCDSPNSTVLGTLESRLTEFMMWNACNNVRINETLGTGSNRLLGRFIDVGLRIIAFEGGHDFAVNYVGVMNVLHETSWGGGVGFSDVFPTDWFVEGMVAGLLWPA
ncbi:hypothetical protein BC830DRAFT_1166575 [Chytriomyces sp. MP71]|nr:hypothetical protein BC830DRAFT_1166575 [Chytriomyces sp. MP71]